MRSLALVLTMLAGAVFAQTNPEEPAKANSKNTQQHLAQIKQKHIDLERGTEKLPVYVKLIEFKEGNVTAVANPEAAEGKISSTTWDWNAISAVLSAIGSLVVAFFTVNLASTTKKLWQESQAAGEISLKSAQAAEKAANSAEHAVQVSREAYIASERPWVSVDAVIGSDLLRTPHGIEFDVNFTVKNHGKSPAINVHIFYEVITLKIASDPFSGVRQRIDELAIQAKAGANMGIQLFPSEGRVIPWRSPLTADEIRKATESHRPQIGFLPSFYVIGSVFYQSPFDEEIRQTGFNYYVCSTNDPRFPKGSDVPDFDTSFPMGRIRLEPVPYSKGTLN